MGSPLPLSLPPVTHSWVPVVRTAHPPPPAQPAPSTQTLNQLLLRRPGRDRDNGFKKAFRRDPSHTRLPSAPSAPIIRLRWDAGHPWAPSLHKPEQKQATRCCSTLQASAGLFSGGPLGASVPLVRCLCAVCWRVETTTLSEMLQCQNVKGTYTWLLIS